MQTSVAGSSGDEHSSGLSGRNNMRTAPLATAATFGFIALLAHGVAAMAAEVKVMAGGGMAGAFGELIPQFESATGHKISIQYGGGAALRKQIEAGEAFDLAIIDSHEVDDLITQGKIARDTRVDIVRVGLGVAVREGAPKPDISSVDAFKNTLLNAQSITYAATGSTAMHLPKVLDRLGIAEQVKAKIKPNALNRVPQVVAAGEVDLAIGGMALLLSAKGVQVVGPLPAELQSWFVNTAGVSTAAKQPDAAKALIKYLATPEAAAVIKAKGMEPLGK
jgi:molybdate transport system substrate-binding protein